MTTAIESLITKWENEIKKLKEDIVEEGYAGSKSMTTHNKLYNLEQRVAELKKAAKKTD